MQNAQVTSLTHGSELSGRFVAVAMILAGLVFTCFYTMIWFRGIIVGYWNTMNLTVLLVFFPLALWLVAGVSVIIRLLNYLDTRIRLEGWEVELAFRAEALRQLEATCIIVTSSEQNRHQRLAPGSRRGMPNLRGQQHDSTRNGLHTARPNSSPVPCICAAGSHGFQALGSTRLPSDTDSPISNALRTTPWFDAEKNSLTPIEVNPEADDTDNRDSRWLQSQRP